MTGRKNHVWDIRGTSCCLRGDFRAMWWDLPVSCDCAFMWHFNYCLRFLLIIQFSPTALDVLTPVTCCLLQRWKHLLFFCSMNKCNCLLLCACPGDLASYFDANSVALCINDRLKQLAKLMRAHFVLFGRRINQTDCFWCVLSYFLVPSFL